MAGAEKSDIARRQKYCLFTNLPSALRSIPYGPDVPAPSPPTYLDDVQLSSGSEISNDESEGVIVDPGIRKPMNDEHFESYLGEADKLTMHL